MKFNKFVLRKGFKIGAIMLASALTFTSCSRDNVINLEPYNQASEDVAFSSPDFVKLSVIGMYNAAQIGYYNGGLRGYPFGAAYFQQNDMRGEDMVSTATFYQYTYMTTYDASGSLNNIAYWSDSYRLINRANLVIEGVTKAIANGVVTKEDGDSYVGEALFFRAMTHLELLKHFARPYNFTAGATHPGVPYRTKASSSLETIAENEKLGRGTVAENYTQILADLNDAEAKLYSKSKRTAGTEAISRITKEAAIALKSRVYLNMRNWAQVITEGNKLNGLYSITANPNDPFAANFKNTESIFSLENSATNNPGVNGALASMYVGRKLIAISPIIWDDPAWLVDDKRRTEGAMVITASGTKYSNKYKDATNLTDASPLLRYAEVLLNRAEAKARLGDASYLQDLNTVRNRSLAAPATQAYTAFASTSAAVNAILKERRIEFLAEGMRWGDIHRLQGDDIAPIDGIPAKFANAVPKAADYHPGTPYVFKASDLPAITTSSSQGYKFLWPIPVIETSANPVLAGQQNPGW